MSTFILSVVLALVSSACASNLAEVQDEELAEEQEMLEDNAADLEEDEQEINEQEFNNEENLEDQQLEVQQIEEGEDQQFQQNQQFDNQFQQNQQFSDQNQLNQNQQFTNQDQMMQDGEQPFQNEGQQFQQDMQAQQGLQFSDDTQPLNEGNPMMEVTEDNEASLTEVDVVEGNEEGVAAADAEGVPPPNEFSGAPPIPGTLKNLASGEAPAEYRIEPGDTLYDICEQLLGEAGYWPKLWAMNDAIKNPHFVYPDFVLQFFPGDADRPPAIGIVGIEELTPEGKLANEELVAEETAKLFEGDNESDLELLNPEDIVVPPEVRDLFRDDNETAVVTESTLVQLPALILPDKLEVIGEIIGGIDGASSIQDDHIGFASGPELESGSVYTVLRYQGAVRDGLINQGYRYDFIANLRVESFTGEAETARAQVFSSVSLARAGDIIVSYRARSRRITPAGGMGGGDTRGRIINLTHNGQRIGATGDFAFLTADIGSDFSKDQVFQIFRNTSSGSQLVGNSSDETHPVGALQVIEVTEQGAISYIISSNKEIMLGDFIGSG